MRARRTLPTAVAMVVVALASSALADPKEPATARDLFDEARRLMSTNDYQGASERLTAALALSSGRGIKFQLAVCYEKLGRVASASALYRDVADSSHEAAELDRERVALRHVAELAPRVPHLRVQVADPQVLVERDRVAIASDALDTPVAVDPGSHALHAERPGYRAWDFVVVVDEGNTAEVRVPELERIVQETPVEAVPLARPPVPSPVARVVTSRSPGVRAAGMVVGGAGLLAVAVGAGFTIASAATYASASSMCDVNDHCSPRGAVIRGDALAYGDVATALVIGGAVALAAGFITWIAAPKKTRTLALLPGGRF